MQDPQWECFVDQISIGSRPPFQFAENNWALCAYSSLADGPHTLTINVTINSNQTFRLDRIQYTPSPNALLENGDVLVENNDPALKYGSGWDSLADSANKTNQTGATFEFNFVGKLFALHAAIAS